MTLPTAKIPAWRLNCQHKDQQIDFHPLSRIPVDVRIITCNHCGEPHRADYWARNASDVPGGVKGPIATTIEAAYEWAESLGIKVVRP